MAEGADVLKKRYCVGADVLMDRYGLPSERVFGVSPVLGRRGFIKSLPAPQMPVCWSSASQGSSSELCLRKIPPCGSAQSKCSAISKATHNLEYAQSSDGAQWFRDARGDLSISQLRSIAMHVPNEQRRTAYEEDLGEPHPAVSSSARRSVVRHPRAASMPSFLDEDGQVDGSRGRASTAPLLSDMSFCRQVGLGSEPQGTAYAAQDAKSKKVGLRKIRSLEKKESLDKYDDDGDARHELVQRPINTSGPNQNNLQNRSKANPFMEFENTEQKAQWERKWLLEDASYVAARTRGLRHNAVHVRLRHREQLELVQEGAEPEAALAQLQSGKSKKQVQAPQFAQQAAPLGQSTRQKVRNELASVKSLKAMQIDLASSLKNFDEVTRSASQEQNPPQPPPRARLRSLRSMIVEADLSKHKRK